MDVSKMSGEQIRVAGMKALFRDLGPAGLVRFLQELEAGAGDYTAEHQEWLPKSDVAGVVAEIHAARRPDEP